MIKFKSSKEMLTRLLNGEDFYNPNSETYVFAYADESICTYHIPEADAKILQKNSLDDGGKFWEEYLSSGGQIFDSAERTPAHRISNLEFCEQMYKLTDWIHTDEVLLRKEG